MANIAAGDVSYSIIRQRVGMQSLQCNLVSLSFGNGVLTYPAGGIPLVIGNMGCPVEIQSMRLSNAGGSGYSFSYDRANSKLMLFQTASHSHPLSLKNAAVADGATTRVNAGANLLGANTGSDISIAGGGANGGVGSGGSGSGAEPSGVAIAAQVLEIEVIGQ